MTNNNLRSSLVCSSLALLVIGAQAFAQKPATSDATVVAQALLNRTANESGGESTVGADGSGQVPTLPNAPAPKQPMTAGEKLRFGMRRAFLNPGSYVGSAIGAYFTERREVKAPGKTSSDIFADGMSRFARGFATNTTAELLGSGLYPVFFKQDPRYQKSKKHGFVARSLYAASRSVVAFGDDGSQQVNYSRLLGNLSSAALANIYERNTVLGRDRFGSPVRFERRVGVGTTFESFGISTAVDAATNIVFEEFDVFGKLRKLFKR